jgi:hypothetical protein
MVLPGEVGIEISVVFWSRNIWVVQGSSAQPKLGSKPSRGTGQRHQKMRGKIRRLAQQTTVRDVQEQHMQQLEHVQALQHKSIKCWALLAKLYLDIAENRIETDTQLMDQYLHGRVGIS